MTEQEMVKRYIYEVTRRMPQDSREDIRMELQALIEDMCVEEQISVEDALQKLGAPDEFARRYRGDGNYLIGPEYYSNYLWVVKLSLAGIGISAVLSAVMQGIFHADSITHFFTAFLKELFTTTISGSYCVIGIITIIFAVMEHQKVKLSLKPEKRWSVKELKKNIAREKRWTPRQLPPVPDKRAIISRSDSVISIIMISLLSVLLTFTPQLFGAFHFENGEFSQIICIFNLNQWNLLLPVLLLWLFIGMIDEIIRLVIGCYCKIVMCSNIICNILEITLAVVLLKILPLWNTDFAKQLKNALGIHQYSKGDILYYWESGFLSDVILAGICVISLAEAGITVYKTVKYCEIRSDK